MKQVKNKRNLLIVFVLLLVLCLAGCGLFQSGEDKLKDLLEDKYGEKFGVESYYYAGDMWSMCYPLSDPTLLFEVRTDGEVTHIVHDYYLQNVVARQVEEEYEPLAQQVFPGCYLSVDISHTLSSIPETFPKADTVTVDDIISYYNENDISSNVVINIFVDTSQMSEDSIEAEYAFLKDVVGSNVANDKLPATIVKLYFGDANFIKECEDVILMNTWMESDIYEKIEVYPMIWIGYDDNGTPYNGPDITLDRYAESRREILNNE